MVLSKTPGCLHKFPRDLHSIFEVARAPLLSARSADKLIARLWDVTASSYLSVQPVKRMLKPREDHVVRTRRLIT